MTEPRPAYPTWPDVVNARKAFETEEALVSAELKKFSGKLTDEQRERQIEIHRKYVDLLRLHYRDQRDLFFAGEQSHHDDAMKTGAIKSEKLAEASLTLAQEESAAGKTRDLLNWLVGFFVLLSAIGTGLQAWEAHGQTAAAQEANAIAREGLRIQQAAKPAGGGE